MPQMTQIVPLWQHPHEMVVINNNTWFLDTTAEQEIDYSVRSIIPMLASKGQDRKLISFTQVSNFTEEFGIGDFKLHGQPYFNGYEFLRNNSSVLGYFMRVTAPDATFAHAVIVAKVKATPGTPADAVTGTAAIPGNLEVYYSAVYLDTFTELDEVMTRVDQLTDTNPDSDGFATYPVALIYTRGRGEYGNNMRFRITKDSSLDKENAFLNYRFDAFEMEESLKLKNSVKGSLYEDAISAAKSIFLEELNNDIEIGGKTFIKTLQGNLETIHDLYVETVNPDVVVPLEQFDFLFGLTKIDMDPIPGLTISTSTQDNAIIFDGAEGISLQKGSDGIFGRARTPGEQIIREAAIEDAYVAAFRGQYDRGILSKRRTPQELFFDANYPETVKYEIITWLTSRGDGYGHLDAGVISTLDEAIAWGERFYNLGDRLYGKNFQSHEILNPFTNKKIRVTYTHHLASNLPTHIDKAGNEQPFAASRSYLNGHVKNSVLPDLDGDDSQTKEVLYELRMNYLETLAENVYYRGTQSTSDIGATRNHWSDLNEENNMYVLLDFKRRLENYCRDQRYNFAEEEDRARFTREAKIIFENDIGIKASSIEVEFNANPWEQERSILHCVLAVTFKSLVKRSIIEIDVNSRV